MSDAIQDRIPHNRCWRCGTLNPRGLHIKSRKDGEWTTCDFAPTPIAGPLRLRARVRERDGRRRIVECTGTAGGREVVRAEVTAVEVRPGWGRPAP